MNHRRVPEPRMEGGRPRPPHAGAWWMDGLAACFSLKPCFCGARGRAPSMGLNEQHKSWNKSNMFNICLVSCVMAHCVFAVNVPKEDERTQIEHVGFYKNKQISGYYKIQNNVYTGMQYTFDEEGKIINRFDYGLPPVERRPLDPETWPQIKIEK